MNRFYESEYEIESMIGGKTKYRYRGKWYHINMDTLAYRWFWFRQLFYAGLALVLTAAAGFLPSRSMYHFFAFITYIVCFPVELGLVIHCAFCPLHPGPMEHMTYDHQYGRQKLFCVLSALLVLAALAAGILALAIDSEPMTLVSAGQSVVLFLVFLVLLRLHLLLRKLTYVRSEKKEDGPIFTEE